MSNRKCLSLLIKIKQQKPTIITNGKIRDKKRKEKRMELT